MVCALPWKTCNCPWFNYEHVEDPDRPSDMRVPYTSRHPDVEVIEVIEEPSPMVRRSSTRTRHRSGRERERERTDSALAAHLQSQLRLEPITPTTSEMLRADAAAQVYGVGNAGGHHMNDSYTVRPMNTSAAHAPVRVPPPRQSYFSSRRPVREVPAPIPAPPAAPASAMAGLSTDGTKRGANRVGTWLNHVQVDPEAINTQARDVEVDDWRCDGTMIGID
jgi:ariadne-1